MSPHVVLALCLLLLVPLPARATPPAVEGHLSVLEPVTVREHFSSTHGDGLKLTFKPLRPDLALARFSVEEARVFVKAMELVFQAPGLLSESSPSRRLTACVVATGIACGPQTSTQPSDLERRVHAGYVEVYGPSSIPLPSSLENSRWFLALKLSPRYMDEGVREAALELLGSPTVAYSIALSMMLYMAAWAMPEPLFSKAFAAAVTLGLSADLHRDGTLQRWAGLPEPVPGGGGCEDTGAVGGGGRALRARQWEEWGCGCW